MYKEHFLVANDKEYIYDEKRGVVVNTRTMDSFQYQIYKRSFYKRMRPDFTDSDYYIWKETWKMGEQYMNQLALRHNLELLRASISGQTSLQPHRRVVRLSNHSNSRISNPFLFSTKGV